MSPAILKWWKARCEADRAAEEAEKLAPQFHCGSIKAHMGVGEDDAPTLFLIHQVTLNKCETYELSEDEMVQLAHFILGDPDEAKETDDAEDQG